MSFLVFSFLFIAGLFVLNKYFMSYWSRRGFPQLQPSFLIGNIGKIMMGKQCASVLFQEVFEKARNLRMVGLYFSIKPMLAIIDPLLVQDIIVRHFNSFHDRPFYVDEVNDPLTGHLFSLKADKWKNLRVKLTPTFSSGKLKSMFPIMKNCSSVLQNHLMNKMAEGQNDFEFEDLFMRYTTNTIASIAFGIENDCITNPDDIFYLTAQKIAKPTTMKRLLDVFSLFVPFVSPRTVEKDVEDFIFSIITQTVEYRESNNVTRKDFMQTLIDLKNNGFVTLDKNQAENSLNEDVKKMTISEIAAQAYVFILAGSETSSTAMHFCLYELAKNPDIQDKVQAEIDEFLATAGTDGFTYESLNELKYLECCFQESLRKYPNPAVLTRMATEDYKISGCDLIIPKGTTVFVSPLGLHRNPEIFENPMEFKPERFLQFPNGSGSSKGLFYVPFGGGPRKCIGARMGTITGLICLAMILSKFKIELSDPEMMDKELEFHPNKTSLAVRDEFHFKLSLREEL